MGCYFLAFGFAADFFATTFFVATFFFAAGCFFVGAIGFFADDFRRVQLNLLL